MVVNPAHFQCSLVGPYGLFYSSPGRFFVGREVAASSTSSEVLNLASIASRFTCIGEIGGFSFSSADSLLGTPEVKEWFEVEDVSFSYDANPDSDMFIAASVFHSKINIWGGWRVFFKDVRGSSDIGYDEDGIDYERLAAYSIKLLLVGGKAERLIKSEGYSLWV
jgi:hypothetical protein